MYKNVYKFNFKKNKMYQKKLSIKKLFSTTYYPFWDYCPLPWGFKAIDIAVGFNGGVYKQVNCFFQVSQ